MRKVFQTILILGIMAAWGILPCGVAKDAVNSSWIVITGNNPSSLENLAANEIKRYIYLRYDELATITRESSNTKAKTAILLAKKGDSILSNLSFGQDISGLKNEEYLIKTIKKDSGNCICIIGGDGLGTLYGTYRLAEKMGIRFYLDSEVIPDKKANPLPELNEKGSPLFAIRGIQPFHDFPEGPDWWNTEEYKAIFAQLPKLRMNFFGLHTYPENAPNAEPSVWIGLPGDSDSKGNVAFSYPSSYHSNLRGNWGDKAKSITDYSHGSEQLFAFDNYSSEVMGKSIPEPETLEECNAVFDRAGAFFADTFTFAKQLSIKLCIGTETPLVIPKKLRNRLKELGMNPDDPKTTEKLYEGIFKRIMATHPLDYYWFWTPETWTWSGNTKEQLDKTKDDFTAAITAAKKLNAPFELATCGWVLGPTPERSNV